MGIDITVKIGGEAGQGIQTVGDLLTLVCQAAGLYTMATNEFESRIRGGNSFFQIRISDQPVAAPFHNVHLLMALNQETYDLYRKEVVPDGLVVMGEVKKTVEANICEAPLGDLAKKAGGRIFTNTVAAGACLSLLGAPFDLFKTILSNRFGPKGLGIIDKNVHAGELGYQAVKDVPFKWAFGWQPGSSKGALMTGSKAIALGALAADCRLAAFYPMSPATGVITELALFVDDFPLVVEQAEDEIAAVNMIIGASFAGVRAMTATSGGGFCLMTEGLGLAAITETPIVIVNAQRPGPATGLPTRTGQGDLQFVIHASQDAFPRFIFAPGTPEEAFDVTVRAFHLAEKFQVPAIILSDKYLADSIFTVGEKLSAPKLVKRFIVTDDDIKTPERYQRFAVTPTGVSPRALPCAGKSLVVVSSDEHRQDGHVSEEIKDRLDMVHKRDAKLPRMIQEMNPPEKYHGEAETLLVSWGSTKGAVQEAVDALREEGLDVGSLNFVYLWPFPCKSADAILKKAKRFLVVEQNSTAQLGQLIKEQLGRCFSTAILKYDGRPFFPSEIIERFKHDARS